MSFSTVKFTANNGVAHNIKPKLLLALLALLLAASFLSFGKAFGNVYEAIPGTDALPFNKKALPAAANAVPQNNKLNNSQPQNSYWKSKNKPASSAGQPALAPANPQSSNPAANSSDQSAPASTPIVETTVETPPPDDNGEETSPAPPQE